MTFGKEKMESSNLEKFWKAKSKVRKFLITFEEILKKEQVKVENF